MSRAAVIRDPVKTVGTGLFGAIQYVAPSVGMEVSAINVRDAAEIERGIAAFARSANGGLILTASRVVVRPSRSDRHAGCSAQTARSLSTDASYVTVAD